MSEKIDLNQADTAALAALPGIDEELARRIVAYREEERPFADVFDLVAVPGVSAQMVRAFEDVVTVGETDGEEAATAAPPAVETEASESAMPAEPAVPPISPEWEKRAQRRGCFSAITGAVFGAILGAVLTLAILAGVNQGSLTYQENDARILRQLQAEGQTRSAALETVRAQLDAVATAEAAANRDLAGDLSVVATRAGQNQTDVARLDDTLEIMDERLSEAAGAAETFNTFLLGLREVVLTLEPELPIPPTATPTAAPAQASQTPGPSATPGPETTPTNRATTRPTRTPRPTSTPLPFPTSTPAPQP